ncbi:hypothetical protein ACFL6B_05810 [Thermodesulfobacteriota bacterium]
MLNALALEHLREMIHVANLRVVDWILNHFYNIGANPRECTDFLRQSIQTRRWLEKNWALLSESVLKHRIS